LLTQTKASHSNSVPSKGLQITKGKEIPGKQKKRRRRKAIRQTQESLEMTRKFYLELKFKLELKIKFIFRLKTKIIQAYLRLSLQQNPSTKLKFKYLIYSSIL